MIRLLILLPIIMGLAASLYHYAEPVGYTFSVPEIAEPEDPNMPEWLERVLIERMIRDLFRDPNEFDPHQCIAKG